MEKAKSRVSFSTEAATQRFVFDIVKRIDMDGWIIFLPPTHSKGTPSLHMKTRIGKTAQINISTLLAPTTIAPISHTTCASVLLCPIEKTTFAITED